MLSISGLFLSFFLGIAIDSTLLSQPENDNGPRTTSGQLYSISSVETIIDSRFKVLAADFQDQIDYLKGKFVKESKTGDKGVFESQHKHEIEKRQTKTSPLNPNKYEDMNSCTFFYPDYPDAGLEKRKNVTIEMQKAGKEEIKKQENNKTKLIIPICEHSTPFCTYIHPDHQDVGKVNGNNTTNVTNNQTTQSPTEVNKTSTTSKDLLWEEMEVLKLQNMNQSKRIDQLEKQLEWERNLDQLLSKTREETVGLKTQNMDQSKRIDQLEQKLGGERNLDQLLNQTREETVEMKTQNMNQSKRIDQLEQKLGGEQNLDQLLNQTRDEMLGLKTQNMEQSKRLDQLEQKLAMLQNSPPASSALTRGNNKDPMKNGGSNNNDGRVSKALTPPSSCRELSMLDHYLDGLYLVKNKQTKKIQTVFCKFSAEDQGYETIIGYNDIKTTLVSFLVTRYFNYDKKSTTIPFETEVFNLGGAMNRQTGFFTAPKKGRYSFSFKTRTHHDTDARVYFRVNGNMLLYVEGYPTYGNLPISTVLDLNVGDRVDCYLSNGIIGSNDGETYFSGILLEEDLALP